MEYLKTSSLKFSSLPSLPPTPKQTNPEKSNYLFRFIFKCSFGEVDLLLKVFACLFVVRLMLSDISKKYFCSSLRLLYKCKNYPGASFYLLDKYIISKDNFYNGGLELEHSSEI